MNIRWSRPRIIRSMVPIIYALPTTLAQLYVLQDTIWSPLDVSFLVEREDGLKLLFQWLYVRTDVIFLPFGLTCQNPCGIYQYMIIGAFVTSKCIKRGLEPTTQVRFGSGDCVSGLRFFSLFLFSFFFFFLLHTRLGDNGYRSCYCL